MVRVFKSKLFIILILFSVFHSNNLFSAVQPITDVAGREIILRGVNVRVRGIFDVSFDDGREPLEFIPEFTQKDTLEMQKIGFNLIRLPINWSGIEPEPGVYNLKYINGIGRILNLCYKAGIYVILDMHQDAYSKEIGEDGAPLWAILPPPKKVNRGGYLPEMFLLRIAPKVQKAFANFWYNSKVFGKGLQDYFIDSMLLVLETYKDHPALIGMQILNEPWLLHAKDFLKSNPLGQGLNLDLLYSFYSKAIPRMKLVAPKKWIFFEPDATKVGHPSLNLNHDRKKFSAQYIPNILPWDPDMTVYSPHLYVPSFLLPGAAPNYSNIRPGDEDIKLSLNNSLKEADAFYAPLFIGEFGFTHKAKKYGETLHSILDFADKYKAHTAQWVWKENSQDAWGFYDFDAGGNPILRTKAVKQTVRAYPKAISGEIKNISYNRKTFELKVHFSYEGLEKPHHLFVPVSYGYPKNYVVYCNNKRVEHKQLDSFGNISVECGNEEDKNYTLKIIKL